MIHSGNRCTLPRLSPVEGARNDASIDTTAVPITGEEADEVDEVDDEGERMKKRTSRTNTLVIGCAMAIALAGCGDDATGPIAANTDDPIGTEDPVDPIDPEVPVEWPEDLLADDALTEGLFGWPETDFGRGNSATIEITRRAGDPAVDFTLKDMQGLPHSLARMLGERPVLMILGSFT